MSFPSACKTIPVSPPLSLREHTCDSAGMILSQNGCLAHEQGHMSGGELTLMEMSEVEYSHLQHLIQAHLEAQVAPLHGLNARSHPATMSPFTSSQAIDLSTSTEEHCLVIPGEKTPASYGEVPGFVLAKVRGEDSPTEPHAESSASSQKQSRSGARVCLEKRFDTMSADTRRPQDIQSAVFSNFLTILQQSAEAQETVIHPQMQKWMKTDRANALEMIGHMPHWPEPKHQGLIIPKSLLLNVCSETLATKPNYTSSSNSTEEQHLVNPGNALAAPAAFSRKPSGTHGSQPVKAAKAAPDSARESGSSTKKKAYSHTSVSQRREKHNSKERERRKRIRSCCDELNMLVPFCNSDSDKVTTLQWTTAFLRYISKTYGDTFKEEFKKSVTDEKGHFVSSTSSGANPVHRESETLSITFAVEQ